MTISFLLTTLIIFIYGTAIGSFLNVIILRLPEGLSLRGRSQCPACEHTLGPIDLIPVVSFLALRGTCRYCKHGISFRYALIELLTGGLFVLVWLLVMPAGLVGVLELIRAWIIVSGLLVIFVIDLECYLILDKVLLPLSLTMLAFNIGLDTAQGQGVIYLHSATLSGLLAAVGGFAIFYALWFVSRGKWIGFGDVKLMIFLGLALGLQGLGVGLFFAFVLGGLIGLLLLASGTKQLSSKIPLGTFLSIGGVVSLLWGPYLLHWYLALIGVR